MLLRRFISTWLRSGRGLDLHLTSLAEARAAIKTVLLELLDPGPWISREMFLD
jgi:hypothetical protein